jgi:hypothetical protein
VHCLRHNEKRRPVKLIAGRRRGVMNYEKKPHPIPFRQYKL